MTERTNLKELRRVRRDFDKQSRLYHDLSLTVHFEVAGLEFDSHDLKSPSYAIMLWQYLGTFSTRETEGFGLTPQSPVDFRKPRVTAVAIVHGAETHRFTRMAQRAGSLLSRQIDIEVINALIRGLPASPDPGKPLFACNQSTLARWLNLMLFPRTRFQTDRPVCATLPVDPFAASLAVFDQLLNAAPAHVRSASPKVVPVKTIKMLFLSANPMNTGRLALDEELRDIQAKIRGAEHRDTFEMVVAPAARPDDVEQALLQHKPVIVHFSGHGSDSKGLVFQSEDPRHSGFVSADAIGHLFRVLRKNVRIVVLNACYSEEQAEAIVREVDFVIGMKSSIGDLAARKFSASFYRGLGFGETVRTAFELGINALKREGLSEDPEVPVLLERSGVSADVSLLDPR